MEIRLQESPSFVNHGNSPGKYRDETGNSGISEGKIFHLKNKWLTEFEVFRFQKEMDQRPLMYSG